MTKKTIRAIAEREGWSVTFERSDVEFSKYSSAGQDFHFSVENDENLAQNIMDYYEGFDCSYETYIWLDSTGHGKNGAPYDMMDIYNDMKEIESDIEKLAIAMDV